MLKPKFLIRSTRIISNCLSRYTSTDKRQDEKKFVRQNFRDDRGVFDMTSETMGLGNSGPTVEEAWDTIKNDPNFLKNAFANFWEQCKLFQAEMRESMRDEKLPTKKGEIDMVYTFENERKLDNFVVTTDTDHDIGNSTASLTTTSRETALFSGFLTQKLRPDGNSKFAGYVNMNSRRPMLSFNRPSYHNWWDYTHLVLKIRGDGRTYMVLLSAPGHYEQTWVQQFGYMLYTRGGPYWQVAKIPFSKFIFAPTGVVQPHVYALKRDEIARVGITLSDNIEGPFSLEIDYIGVENNQYHTELIAYESYHTNAPN